MGPQRNRPREVGGYHRQQADPPVAGCTHLPHVVDPAGGRAADGRRRRRSRNVATSSPVPLNHTAVVPRSGNNCPTESHQSHAVTAVSTVARRSTPPTVRTAPDVCTRTRPASGHPHRPRQPGPGHDPHGPASPGSRRAGAAWSGSRRRSASRCCWPAWSRPARRAGASTRSSRATRCPTSRRGTTPRSPSWSRSNRLPGNGNLIIAGTALRVPGAGGGPAAGTAPAPTWSSAATRCPASRARYGVSQDADRPGEPPAELEHRACSAPRLVIPGGQQPGHQRAAAPPAATPSPAARTASRRGRRRRAQPLAAGPPQPALAVADARHHRREGAGQRGRPGAGPRRELPGVGLEHARRSRWPTRSAPCR